MLVTVLELKQIADSLSLFDTAATLANEHRHEISNNMEFATCKDSDQPAHTHSLIRTFASRLNII